MALIDVKYVRAENLTNEERKELEIEAKIGLVAIETTNPDLKRKGIVIDNYVDYLLGLAD
jgi:hypothetical protein